MGSQEFRGNSGTDSSRAHEVQVICGPVELGTPPESGHCEITLDGLLRGWNQSLYSLNVRFFSSSITDSGFSSFCYLNYILIERYFTVTAMDRQTMNSGLDLGDMRYSAT